jgi:hypothetical protein
MHMRLLLTCLLTFIVATPPVMAEGRSWIGTARIFNNDFLGDGRDRWRSGSYTFSHLRGRAPYTGVPQSFGDILEFRFHSELIAPSGASTTTADRPYVGALSLGVFTHFGQDAVRYTLGLDVTAVGPQTGVSAFQERFHDQYDLPQPPFVDQQLGNDFWVSAYGEAATHFVISDTAGLRPFVASQIGAEDLLRIGFDLRISEHGHDALYVRDSVTGHLSPATQDASAGLSFVAGADVAFVADSKYLPSDQGYEASDRRTRARVGLGYQFAQGSSIFYGATYLSPEFEGQSEGQILGSLRLNFNF